MVFVDIAHDADAIGVVRELMVRRGAQAHREDGARCWTDRAEAFDGASLDRLDNPGLQGVVALHRVVVAEAVEFGERRAESQ